MLWTAFILWLVSVLIPMIYWKSFHVWHVRGSNIYYINSKSTVSCDSNKIQTQNHLVHKRTLNHLAIFPSLASLAKWLSVHLRTKWLCLHIWLQSLKLQISSLLFLRIPLTLKTYLYWTLTESFLHFCVLDDLFRLHTAEP